MKYHEIQKEQMGGRVFFSAVADPSAQAAQQSSAATTGSTKSDPLISESLMNKLYENAMPNDFRKFTSMLETFQHQVDMGLPVNKRALYDLQAYANQIIQQSDYMKKAEQQAINNGSWDEVAITNNGYIYAMDANGKVQTVAINKFDKEKYQALSVGELIQLRREDNQLINNQSIVTTVGNAIGTEKIQDYIKSIIQMVGSAETSVEAYKDLAGIVGDLAKKPTASELATIQGLSRQMETIGTDAIFKVTEETSNKNIREASAYILSMLPKNMRMQLQGKWVAEYGQDYADADKYAENLIGLALSAANDSSYKSKIDYAGTMNTAAGTKSGTPKDHEANMTGLQQLIAGTLGRRTYQITDKTNPGLVLELQGTGMGVLTDAKNDIVNEMILSDALNSGLGALIDKNNIFFGTQKISPQMLDQFVYDGADVVNVWAPVGPDGNVDFNKLRQFEALVAKVKANPSLKPEDIAELMAEIGINGTLDKNYNFIGNDPNMQQFIVLTALTSDEVIDDDENSITYTLDGTDKDYTFAKIREVYAKANKGFKGDAQRQFKTGWFDRTTDLIAGPVFMRVNPTAKYDAGTITGNGARVVTPRYPDLVARDQARQINQPSSSLL